MENLNKATFIDLYQYMLASRESDLIESELVNSGEANFLASSKGHEGSVILAPLLQKSDWLHCHYRDKALMLARGITNEMFFYSALAKAESHSSGRQMVSHMSAPELNIMSIVGPVGNNALQAAGVAHAIKEQIDNPIVLCSIGDGTSQQGEVFEAIAEAKRSNLPILFFIHDNNLAISTRTQGKTFFSLPGGKIVDSFYDTPITYLDGTHPYEGYEQLKNIITSIRTTKSPQIIVFKVDRLDNHSNADNQKLYRDENELELSKKNDPIYNSFNFLKKLTTEDSLENIKKDTIASVRKAIDIARSGKEPRACYTAEKPLNLNITEYRGDFAAENRLTMLEAIRQIFNYHLSNDKNICLLGEDIEDAKGDVFGITRGLSTAFPNQVKNSALSESTIAGLACGLALAGKKPVAFIQFADFMPLAYNQIFTEISTMYWRTNGHWQCPVIIFAACGAYRPGLGPFHSQTNESTYAHIPGLDVYMPSNAADAAGMLNAAFQSGRPSVYLYPKKLLNNKSVLDTTSVDIQNQIIPTGKARIAKAGTDITLIGWGNTIALCHMVAESLENIAIEAEIIDLRTIKPYDINTILKSVEKTRHLIVTHEDNITCGMGGEILAMVMEKSKYSIKAKRVARDDTYTPCNYSNQLEILPSYEKILTAVAELLDLSLTWKTEEDEDSNSYLVEVIGASPSDESVLINKIHVKIGDSIKSGDTIADIEASKSIGEILSPQAGVVEQIYVKETESALVGNPLIRMRLDHIVPKTEKQKTKHAILKRKSQSTTLSQKVSQEVFPVGLCVPHFKTGSKKIMTEELLKYFPNISYEDVIKRTGIENRYWLDKNESIIDLAAKAAHEALSSSNLQLSDINGIICATCTPEKYQSPSVACLILNKLYEIYGEHIIPAYDINAACSGYIFALQNAKDYLQCRPKERILLITAEALSKHINLKDFDTAFLFGDATTATIIVGNDHINNSKAIINQIYLVANAENGDTLNVPIAENEGITLKGKKLFNFAVKTMAKTMFKCCQLDGIELSKLDLIIPHQANQRIINSVENHLNIKAGSLHSNIASYGNTSSCTIPIALAETLPQTSKNNRVALCAFGGGFTAGAALLTVI